MAVDRASSRRRPDRAGRAALRLYDAQGPAERLHVRVRWLSAPFPAVAAYLPAEGRILEIGCGHGLFAAYAALAGPRRSVRGSDIDATKIAAAQRAAAGAGDRLRFEVAASGAVPAGPWDAVVILDVLYLLPADAQRRLLQDCVAQLAPHGHLLVKEMADRPGWKVRWNRLQETLAVAVLGITDQDRAASGPGDRLTFVPTAQLLGWLHAEGLRTEVVALDRHRLHPHQLVVARHREAPG